MIRHRKLRITAYLLSAVFLVLTIAYAGEYHASKEATAGKTAETLVCSQCHTMHGSQGAASMIYTGSAGPIVARLLRADTAQKLCIYCHGSTSPGLIDGVRQPPMVVNTGGGSPAYAPSAGDFADRGFASEPNRHSIDLDLTTITPPGNTNAAAWASVKTKFGNLFNCIYCHDQHGNMNYRNLRYDPGNPANDSWGSAGKVIVNYRMNAAGTCSDGNGTTCDADNSTAGALTPANLNKYQRSNVSFYKATAAGADYNRISAWCGKCHGSSAAPGFFGISGDANMGGAALAGVGSGDTNTVTSPWVRHPAGDVNIAPGTNYHADSTLLTTVRYADADTTLKNGNEQPFCLSCHYAHGGGNGNSTAVCDNSVTMCSDHSNLVMFNDAGAINLVGAAAPSPPYRMRNTCNQCHNQ